VVTHGSLNSKTGQFALLVAGIKSYGTQAAGESFPMPSILERLSFGSSDWPRENLQIVIEIGLARIFCPGPPQAIAS